MVLKIISPVAGDEIASRCAVVILGGSNPLSVELISNMETLNQILAKQLDGIKAMLDVARENAEKHLVELRATAVATTQDIIGSELLRLSELMKVNPNVREEELEYLVLNRELILEAIANSGMRLDAIRVIVAA